MAIDNNSLCYLFDPIFQVENIRGIPIVGGHIEVFIAGTDQKYITWQNFDGARNPFKIPLNNDGRATILVETNYTYDAYIYDSFNNMVCSRLNIRPVVGGDIVVSGITQVWHDESLSGDGTLQSPLTVVSAGKVYSGIAPIVVNNDEDKISANHVPLGLQEPLFFVEDSESACIIGCSAQSELPEGTMNESAFSYDASSNITAYNGSAFKAGDEFPESATEAINVVTANSAKWNGPYVPLGVGNNVDTYSLAQGFRNSAAFWSMAQGSENTANDRSLAQGSYNTAIGDSLAQGVYNYAEDESMAQGEHNSAYKHSIAQGDNNIARNNSQAFGEHLIATASGMAIGQYNLKNDAAFVIGNGSAGARSDAFIIDHSGNVSAQGDISASGVSLTSFYTNYKTNSANFITALPADLVYTGDLNDYAKKDFVNDSIDSATSGLLPTSSFSSVSSDFITALPSDLVYTADITGLATTGDLTNKLDTTAFSTVSGDFLTAHQDLSDYQTISGMTAYQEAGNYYSASNPSGFITGIPDDLAPTTLNVKGIIESYESEQEGVSITQTGIELYSDIDGYEDVTIAAIRNWNSTYETVSTNSASWTATTIPSEVTAAASAVSSNSANWNSTYNTVSANSADWSVSEEISGINGIKISESADKVIIEVSADYYSASNPSGFITGVDLTPYQTTAGMTAYQEAGNYYSASNPSGFITGINYNTGSI